MAMNLWAHFYCAITLISESRSGPPHFDLNDPKILLGLLIGGSLPYFIPAIPAGITKWLLFVFAFKAWPRPKALRLCAVAIAEAFCLFVAVMITMWLYGFDVPPSIAPGLTFVLYGLLAAFPNLMLLRPDDKSNDYPILHKSFLAFAIGFIYLGYFLLFWWLIQQVAHLLIFASIIRPASRFICQA